MKITVNNYLVLSQLLSKWSTEKIPLKLAYKITKLINETQNISEFYKTHFQSIIEQYSAKDAEGNPIYQDESSIKIDETKLDECQTAINELMDLQVDFPDIKFTLDELDNFTLTVQEMTSLAPYIEE